jgi:hypothetical protein
MFRSSLIANARFQSVTSAGAQAEAEGTVTGKIKTEGKKVLRMYLFIMPLMFFGLWYMYPPPSKEEEARMRREYEKHAGWKT